MTTPIHGRIERTRAGNDPQLIARVRTGFAILANQQPEPITGCCMLLPDLPIDLLEGTDCDPTPAHLNDLPAKAREAFLADMATLGDAVQAATGCDRLNYLILCNQVPALHAHVVPRFDHEDPDKRLMDPFAAYDFGGARKADATTTDAELLAKLQAAMRTP